MIKHNQDGAINGLVVSLVLTVLLLLGAMGFGYWAFSGRQDYKDHSDAKAAAAVKVAVAKNSTAKDKQFAEEAKNPLTSYSAPDAVGSLVIKYPKTWSGYVVPSLNSGTPTLKAYFNPGVVPSVGDNKAVFALQVEVLGKSYSQTLQEYTNGEHAGRLTASAYALPQLPNVVGTRVHGTLTNGTIANIVVVPLRSESIRITTQGNQFLNDFNNYILPNFSFSP